MILFGASGHAKVILDTLEKQGIKVDFLVDANREIKTLQSYSVVNELEYKFKETDKVIVSIGSNTIRQKIVEKLKVKYGWAIHPSAVLGDDVVIGEGTVVMAGAVINSSSVIGSHSIINTSASVDHDCVLGDFVHVSPNATLCGHVSVGEGTQIGAGATVIPTLSIGKGATIGAGTVVLSNIPDYAIVAGNPGKIIKYNDREV